jgi:hypothetical protein
MGEYEVESRWEEWERWDKGEYYEPGKKEWKYGDYFAPCSIQFFSRAT